MNQQVSVSEVPAEILKAVEDWRLAKEEADSVKPIIKKEQELRKVAMEILFPNPEEGTQYYPLPEGWRVKGVFKLDRKVDQSAWPAVAEKLREEFGINPDLLVAWEPKLKSGTYRELTEEQRMAADEALDIKPGSPTFELLPPKAKK